ncbi:MAG: twin-arginine translocation pathway signal [Burkholderiales bacterium]|nr:MAG: twin-arginine translocation pathway signal [Burkholderiales bacterium]
MRPLRWLAIVATVSLGACAHLGLRGDPHPPIVFVHGEGDSAALWQTTIWRFESNGWPRGRLHAIDVPYPLSRDDDAQARSPTGDPLKALSHEVDRVLARTGARKVVLVGDSRGGDAIRHYLGEGDGATKVSRAILGGAPNDGIGATRLRLGRSDTVPGLAWLAAPQGPRGFEQIWTFITEQPPSRTAIVAETAPVLDGRISRPGTNLPMAGVRVEVFEVAPQTGERLGPPAHVLTTGADGRWGPMTARSDAPYEFVLSAPGFAITHVYRSAFPRASGIVNMHPTRLADADRSAGSVVTMTRPRGYFDLRRDRMSLDGAALPGVSPGAVGVSEAKLVLPPGPVRTVIAEVNGERIAVRTWPASENRAVVAELHY